MNINSSTNDLTTSLNHRADEFARLYATVERKLYVYIVSLIANPLDAYDLLQETSLILWQKFDQFEQGSNFLAWAREVARLRVLRYRRMQATNLLSLHDEAIEVLSRTTLPEGEYPDHLLFQEFLAGCIESLSDSDRELIRKRYSKGIPVQILAESLNRSANAVSHSLGRIRRLLRTCIEQTFQRRQAELGADK